MPAIPVAAGPASLAEVVFRPLFALFVLVSCSAAKQYYPVMEHPRLTADALQSVPGRPAAAVVFEFYSRGKPSDWVTRKWQPILTQMLRDTGRFSESPDSAYRFIIRMDNSADSRAGPMTQGALSGLTLGLIGTKVTDNYAIKAEFVQGGSTVATREYHYAITTTSGAIKGKVEGIAPYDTQDGAFRKILDQCLLKFLDDLQESGVMGH